MVRKLYDYEDHSWAGKVEDDVKQEKDGVIPRKTLYCTV